MRGGLSVAACFLLSCFVNDVVESSDTGTVAGSGPGPSTGASGPGPGPSTGGSAGAPNGMGGNTGGSGNGGAPGTGGMGLGGVGGTGGCDPNHYLRFANGQKTATIETSGDFQYTSDFSFGASVRIPAVAGVASTRYVMSSVSESTGFNLALRENGGVVVAVAQVFTTLSTPLCQIESSTIVPAGIATFTPIKVFYKKSMDPMKPELSLTVGSSPPSTLECGDGSEADPEALPSSANIVVGGQAGDPNGSFIGDLDDVFLRAKDEDLICNNDMTAHFDFEIPEAPQGVPAVCPDPVAVFMGLAIPAPTVKSDCDP